MTSSPDDARDLRVGTAEREAAIAALNRQWQAGRLDPTEHEARTTSAHAAITRGDLDVLFADLPESWVPPAPVSARPSPAEQAGSGSTSGGLVSDQSFLGRRRDLVMALMPFVCLLLFFTVARHWLVWLLIPVTAIVLYGADGKRGRPDRR